MSAITVSPASVGTIGPAIVRTRRERVSTITPLRLTRRGRVVLLALFVALIGVAMTFVGGLAAASRDAGPGPDVRIVSVQPGQTLYGIASSLVRGGDVQETVYEIEQLNALPSADISVGQRIALPVHR